MLANTGSNFGVLLVEIGKHNEALVEYQAALELQKKLAKQFPDASAYQAGLADTHNSLGLLLAQLGKRDQARLEHVAANEREEARRAIPCYRPLPNRPRWRLLQLRQPALRRREVGGESASASTMLSEFCNSASRRIQRIGPPNST